MAIHVGDVGRAVSPMCPSGAVEVNGERLDARSENGFVEVGSPVVVIRGDPTGYVVWKIGPGLPLPQLTNQGEVIRKADFQMTGQEAKVANRREQATERPRPSLKAGYSAVASLGAVVGLGSGGAAWCFGCVDFANPLQLLTLLGGSLAVGLAAGPILFTLTGLAGAVREYFQEGEAQFAPHFLTTSAGLLGTAVGFWWQYVTGSPAGLIALWSVGLALACGAVAYVLSRLGEIALTTASGDS